MHTRPQLPLPPLKPPRQKFETEIPELSQDLKSESHDGWTFEEDEYINITLLNTPFSDAKSLMAPKVRLREFVEKSFDIVYFYFSVLQTMENFTYSSSEKK